MNFDRSLDVQINHLRTFQLVMKEGGYAAAARVSQLSVPSVWQHIRSLEKAYGVSLFERVGRQVIPTDAARNLHHQVETILVQLESTFDLVNESARSRTLRMVTGARMMLEELAAPLATFRKRFPNHLVLRQGNDRVAGKLLLGDEADLALALEPGMDQTSPQIHYEPAYTVEFMAVCRKTHPFARAKSHGLRELAKHDLIVTVAGTHGRDALDHAFHRERLDAKIVAETDNSAFTISCVAAGMGVGILAGRPGGDLCRKLAIKTLGKQLGHRQLVLMWQKGRLLTEPMLGLIDEIKSIDIP